MESSMNLQQKQCQFCSEQFNNQQKLPKILRCQHIFCIQCLNDILYEEDIGTTCSLDNTIDPTPINQLKTATNILQMIENQYEGEEGLYIGNLPQDVLDQEIMEAFKFCGINLVRTNEIQRISNPSYAWCFARVLKSDYQKALDSDKQIEIRGRKVFINREQIKKIVIENVPLNINESQIEYVLKKYGNCKVILKKQKQGQFNNAFVTSVTRQDEVEIMSHQNQWKQEFPNDLIIAYLFNYQKKKEQEHYQNMNQSKILQINNQLLSNQSKLQQVNIEILKHQQQIQKIEEQLSSKKNIIQNKYDDYLKVQDKISNLLKDYMKRFESSSQQWSNVESNIFINSNYTSQ